MEVSQSDCSSVNSKLADSSDGRPRQVLPPAGYLIDTVVVLASMTDNDGSHCPVSALLLYDNVAAEVSVFVFAAYTISWIQGQPGPFG